MSGDDERWGFSKADRTESTDRDLDVEAGTDEASGRFPGIGDAHAGQGDDAAMSDVAAVSSEGDCGKGESTRATCNLG